MPNRAPRSPASRTALSARALNRTLLGRQTLLRRRPLDVMDAIEGLVGIQAQVPRDPYVGLWSRLDRFRPEHLSELIGARRAVRMTLLRATLHLVTARDAVALRHAVDPAIRRAFRSGSPFARRLEGVDLNEMTTIAAELLAERPRTRAELGPLLAERWPDRDPSSLAYGVTYLLPLVQVTPRGLWGRTGPSAFTTVDSWLGTPPTAETTQEDLLMRYLAAFGPSTAADAQAWSGLPALRSVLDRMRPHLRTFLDERGRELFDVPDAPLFDPDVTAPPRLLPEYDNVFLAHADRARIVTDSHRQAMFEVGWGQLLVDGFIAARWRIDPNEADVVVVRAYRQLSGAERDAVADEAVRLVSFVRGGEGRHDVRFLRA